MFSDTHFIFKLFETNFVFMLFAPMLFGNSPLQLIVIVERTKCEYEVIVSEL